MPAPPNIEIFCPPPDPPIVVATTDDAWMLCAAVNANDDDVMVVLVDDDQEVLALLAAAGDLVEVALDDPAPLVRLVEAFGATRLYAAAATDEAAELIGRLAVELWPAVIELELLPPMPRAA